jgi:hypothetical protein
LEVGDEHRDQCVALNISDTDPCLDQGAFKGQAATDQEGDEVIAPEISYLLPLLNQLALSVNTVAGQVGTKVGTWG